MGDRSGGRVNSNFLRPSIRTERMSEHLASEEARAREREARRRNMYREMYQRQTDGRRTTDGRVPSQPIPGFAQRVKSKTNTQKKNQIRNERSKQARKEANKLPKVIAVEIPPEEKIIVDEDTEQTYNICICYGNFTKGPGPQEDNYSTSMLRTEANCKVQMEMDSASRSRALGQGVTGIFDDFNNINNKIKQEFTDLGKKLEQRHTTVIHCAGAIKDEDTTVKEFWRIIKNGPNPTDHTVTVDHIARFEGENPVLYMKVSSDLMNKTRGSLLKDIKTGNKARITKYSVPRVTHLALKKPGKEGKMAIEKHLYNNRVGIIPINQILGPYLEGPNICMRNSGKKDFKEFFKLDPRKKSGRTPPPWKMEVDQEVGVHVTQPDGASGGVHWAPNEPREEEVEERSESSDRSRSRSRSSSETRSRSPSETKSRSTSPIKRLPRPQTPLSDLSSSDEYLYGCAGFISNEVMKHEHCTGGDDGTGTGYPTQPEPEYQGNYPQHRHQNQIDSTEEEADDCDCGVPLQHHHYPEEIHSDDSNVNEEEIDIENYEESIGDPSNEDNYENPYGKIARELHGGVTQLTINVKPVMKVNVQESGNKTSCTKLEKTKSPVHTHNTSETPIDLSNQKPILYKPPKMRKEEMSQNSFVLEINANDALVRDLLVDSDEDAREETDTTMIPDDPDTTTETDIHSDLPAQNDNMMMVNPATWLPDQELDPGHIEPRQVDPRKRYKKKIKIKTTSNCGASESSEKTEEETDAARKKTVFKKSHHKTEPESHNSGETGGEQTSSRVPDEVPDTPLPDDRKLNQAEWFDPKKLSPAEKEEINKD